VLIRRAHDPFAGKWAIPGGFLEIGEDAEAGARRELLEETGLELTGLIEPIGFFARPDRDPRGRTISLAFAGLALAGSEGIHGSDDASEAAWFDSGQLPELAFDHAEILKVAEQWLKDGLRGGQLGPALLPASSSPEDLETLLRFAGLTSLESTGWIQKPQPSGRFTQEPAQPDRGVEGDAPAAE
jgi:8-oxo-dGTP diphosphatase